MNININNIADFERWFKDKLLLEKEKRLKFIENTWNNIAPGDRLDLLHELGNNEFINYSNFVIEKDYFELYLIIREQLESYYEAIKEWKMNNKK